MQSNTFMKLFLACLSVLLMMALPAMAQMVDPDLKPYTPVSGVSGSIKSVGSDSMNNEMTLWAEGFLSFYPNVQIEIEGKGSSTAPVALIAGTAQFGPMSRAMKAKEIDDFEKRYGYKPTALRTSIDMLAVYVNKDNPSRDSRCSSWTPFSPRAPRRFRQGYPHLGRSGPDRRVGQCAHQPLRPQRGFGHLRLFQGECAVRW
jgi:ABC-type phosphate transport system substrate-binding protein